MDTIPGSVEINQIKETIFDISKITLLTALRADVLLLLRSRISEPIRKTVKLK